MKSTVHVHPVQLWSWYVSCSHQFFFYISKTATEVARQQSLINNALFLTFATMCHYQKGLDFPGVTFRSWVRWTVSTSRSANGDQYLFFLYGNERKRVGVGVSNQIIEHKHSVIFFFFYRHITWRALWDFRLALSAKTKSCVSPFFPHTEAEDFWNKPTDTQLWHFITLSSYSWSVGKEAWSNNLRCVSIHLTNVKSNFHSNSCSLTTHERNVFTLLKPY